VEEAVQRRIASQEEIIPNGRNARKKVREIGRERHFFGRRNANENQIWKRDEGHNNGALDFMIGGRHFFYLL
jgi:hypothetical protein